MLRVRREGGRRETDLNISFNKEYNKY